MPRWCNYTQTRSPRRMSHKHLAPKQIGYHWIHDNISEEVNPTLFFYRQRLNTCLVYIGFPDSLRMNTCFSCWIHSRLSRYSSSWESSPSSSSPGSVSVVVVSSEGVFSSSSVIATLPMPPTSSLSWNNGNNSEFLFYIAEVVLRDRIVRGVGMTLHKSLLIIGHISWIMNVHTRVSAYICACVWCVIGRIFNSLFIAAIFGGNEQASRSGL